jgi:predicted AAA+ superfamily ATPase
MLEQTFVLRVLLPYEVNLKKRLIRSPKIYVRDSGLLHALLDIETHDNLLGHPVYGASWEGFVVENVLSVLPDWRAFFYRTSSGSEVDLILTRGKRRIAIECKASTSPDLNRGFWNAINDLVIEEVWVIAPVRDFYPIEMNVKVSPLWKFLDYMKRLDRHQSNKV